jgi:hypothetical protein
LEISRATAEDQFQCPCGTKTLSPAYLHEHVKKCERAADVAKKQGSITLKNLLTLAEELAAEEISIFDKVTDVDVFPDCVGISLRYFV